MTKTLQLVEIDDEVYAVDATADVVDAVEYGERVWTARGTVPVLTLEEAKAIANGKRPVSDLPIDPQERADVIELESAGEWSATG